MKTPNIWGSMANDTLKKIEQLKSKLAALEGDLHAGLAKLPGQYGFATAEEFLAAFRKAVSERPAGRKAPKAAKAPKAPKADKKPSGRKPRVKVTPEIEATVKVLLAEGKTGKQIAEVTGVSIPTVHNLKKKLRGPTGTAPAAAS
jgi:pyruvate/2-oxoglutarate dehydrogenase complex dihydrolipoamide acyltransferase (E2) component